MSVTTSLLTWPPSTISTTSIVSASVTRMPWTNSPFLPMRASCSSICGPPPCTITGFMPTSFSSTTAAAFRLHAPCVLLDGELLRGCGRLLGQRQFEHAVRVLGAGAGVVDFLAQPESARHRAEVALAVQNALAVFFIALGARLGSDRN